MVWNEELKREIPEGWEVKRLDEVFSVIMGTSPKGDSINEKKNGIPFYQGKVDFGSRFPSVRAYTTSPVKFASCGDTLLSVRAPVGSLNRAIENCSIGRGIASIHSDEFPSFTYYTCLAMKGIFERYDANGTTFGCIGKNDFHSIFCAVPLKSLIQHYERISNAIDQNIENYQKETNLLSSLRDFLLPLLMNGQCSIKCDSLN